MMKPPRLEIYMDFLDETISTIIFVVFFLFLLFLVVEMLLEFIFNWLHNVFGSKRKKYK